MVDDWFRLLAWQRPLWLPIVGSSPRVILSCQVSISRNLQGMHFPPFAGQSDSARNVRQILHSELKRVSGWSDGRLLDPHLLLTQQRLLLFEQGHFPGSFCIPHRHNLALLHPNERCYCYLNDQDHLRITSWGQELELASTHQECQELIDALEGKLTFAQDEYYGYLCRDTNLCGAGTKLEVFLHLPALKLVMRTDSNSKIDQLLTACQETGFLLYNMPHCEHNSIFVVGSNHIAMNAIPESIEKLSNLATNLAECELQERRQLAQHDPISLLDTVDRAYGLARHARQMQFDEYQNCLSALWLGRECEIFQNFETGVILDLFGASGMATLAMQQDHQQSSESWTEDYFAQHRVKVLRDSLHLPERPGLTS